MRITSKRLENAIRLTLLAFALIPPAARAAYPVPSGCVVPSTAAPAHTFYVDPVNGSMSNDGSAGAPWSTLTAVIAAGKISTREYQLPYSTSSALVPVNAGGPVQPGDQILLLNGNHGDVTIQNAVNSDFITVAAAPGQTPVLNSLTLHGASRWVFTGLKIQSLANGYSALVLIQFSGFVGPVDNVIVNGNVINSQDDVSAWTETDWQNLGRNEAIELDGYHTPGYDVNCITISSNQVSNVRFGFAIGADSSVVTGNTLINFGDDALDYDANNLEISHNFFTDSHDLGDGNHNDFMQGQIGRGALPTSTGTLTFFSNISIHDNILIRRSDPNLTFPGTLQGIDAFDGDWTNVQVFNNAVITNAYNGISFASLHNGSIVNNTLLSDNAETNYDTWIDVSATTHESPYPSSAVVVRNNICTVLSIGLSTGVVTVDHNVSSVQIALDIGGVIHFYSAAGTYGNQNVLAPNLNAGFVVFDTSTWRFDLHLGGSSPAVAAGTTTLAPADDLPGTARTAPIDAGAYAYAAGAVPVLDVLSPADGAVVAGNLLAAAGSVSDPVLVSSVAASIDGGAFTLASGTGSWSASLSLGGLALGAHTISVEAWDALGRAVVSAPLRVVLTSTKTTIGLALDPADPASAIFAVNSTDPSFPNASPLPATLNLPWGALPESLNQISPSLYYVRVATSSLGTSFASLSGSTVSVTAGAAVFPGLGEWGYVLPALGGKVTDAAGMAATVIGPGALSAPAQVLISTQPPNAAAATALATAGYASLGADRCIEMVSTGTVSTATVTMPFNPSQSPPGVSSSSWRVGHFINGGSWVLLATGTVSAGSIQAVESVGFGITGCLYQPIALSTGTGQLALTIAAPASGAVIAGSSAAVSGYGFDGAAISSVAVAVDGGAFALAVGTASWSFTLNTLPLTNGVHSLTAKAWDGVGQSTSTSVAVIVNNSTPTAGPSVYITAPPGGSAISGSAVAVTGVVIDGVAVSSVGVSVDGGAFSLASGTAAWNYSLNTLFFSSGPHTLTARAWDSAGLSSTASIPVVIANASYTFVGLGWDPLVSTQAVVLIETTNPTFTGSASFTAQIPFPSELQSLTFVQISSAPLRYLSRDAITLFSALDLYISSAAIPTSVTAGTVTVSAVYQPRLIAPAIGARVLESGGPAMIMFPPGSLTADAQASIDAEPADPGGARAAALAAQGYASLGAGRDILFVSSGGFSSASLTLPYSPALIPAGVESSALQIAYFNTTTSHWQLISGPSVDSVNGLITVPVTHFSIYHPVGILPQTAPGLNAALVYPNPASPPYDPTIRICPGVVDSVDVTVFDVAGRVVHSATIDGGASFIPSAGAGAGQYCYEHVWTGRKASGVYFAVVHAKGSGTTIKARLRFAVIR
jgi:hypothetical protein